MSVKVLLVTHILGPNIVTLYDCMENAGTSIQLSHGYNWNKRKGDWNQCECLVIADIKNTQNLMLDEKRIQRTTVFSLDMWKVRRVILKCYIAAVT